MDEFVSKFSNGDDLKFDVDNVYGQLREREDRRPRCEPCQSQKASPSPFPAQRKPFPHPPATIVAYSSPNQRRGASQPASTNLRDSSSLPTNPPNPPIAWPLTISRLNQRLTLRGRHHVRRALQTRVDLGEDPGRNSGPRNPQWPT